MTTKEYLKRCDEINLTIAHLRRQPNPYKGLEWLSNRTSIHAPKSHWDKMIDELVEQKRVLKERRDYALRYGYGFAD
jgi:hypothetical protein